MRVVFVAGSRLSGLAIGVLAILLPLISCTRYVEVAPGADGRAYYQTASPLHDTSERLERVLRSVRRIQSRVAYTTYVFSEDSAPLRSELASPGILGGAVDTVASSQERAATAVLVSRTGRNLSLVTVAHALTFPDTVVELFGRGRPSDPPDAEVGGARRVERISIKTRQTSWILDLPELDTFEVLARDESADVALIGVAYPEDEDLQDLEIYEGVVGEPDRLALGSFVYVLGYPRGYPMVTRGIVSTPTHPAMRSFLVDGLWNRGMSGGPILAVRGDGETLEWVGIARAAAGSVETRLVPEEDALEEYGEVRPYDGPIFLEEHRQIDYGIMHSVTMTDIRRLVDEHREDLAERGYELPDL